MNDATQTRKSLAEILASPDFQRCTAKQQAWLRLFFENGENTGTFDALLPTQKVYAVNPKNVAVLTAQIQNSRRVRKILNLYFGISPFDAVMADLTVAVERSIRHDKKKGFLSNATVRGAALLGMRVSHRDTAPSIALEDEDEPERSAGFRVGETAQLAGKRFRVTAVNEQGEVTEAVPL